MLFSPIFGRSVPRGIERLEITEQIAQGHPARLILILRNVTDLLEVAALQLARVDAQHGGFTGRGRMQVHHQLERCGFARTIRPQQRVDAAFRNGQRKLAERHQFAVALGEIVRSKNVAHDFLPFREPSRRSQ